MRIPRPKSKTKFILLSSVIAVILAGGGAVTYVYAFHGNLFGWTSTHNKPSQSSPDLNKPSAEQTKAGNDIKKTSVDNTSKPDASHSDAPSDTSQTGSVDVTITATAQNGNLFQLRALISSIESSGTCTLTLTKGQTTVTKYSDVQALSTTSTCQGFDVTTSELSPGQWKATVTYKGASVMGTASKDVTIQ